MAKDTLAFRDAMAIWNSVSRMGCRNSLTRYGRHAFSEELRQIKDAKNKVLGKLGNCAVVLPDIGD